MASARTFPEILQRLAVEYQELNGSLYETLNTPPSALEFSRLIHISRPVVIKGVKIPATTKWTDEYLADSMGASEISVAVTPNGQADAVAIGPDGLKYFVEPHVQKMSMKKLLAALRQEDSRDGAGSSSEVYYLQSQNGNLFSSSSSFTSTYAPTDYPSEFTPLRKDVPKEISWASEALGRSPDAVNIWVGDGRSVTSIHSDPYENIYFVVRGAKHFTLFPPSEGWCLRERSYPHATYTRLSADSYLSLTPSTEAPAVRWSSVVDPLTLPPEARPLRVTLLAGDTLYLPAGWWHHVRQSGVTIALNWWYDIEVRGTSWVWLSFLRGEESEVPDGNADESDHMK